MRTLLATIAAILTLPLVLSAVILAAPFRAVAGATVRLARRLEPQAHPWGELTEFHADVGWKPKPDLMTHALDFNGEPFRVVTDADGWRGGGTVAESDVVVFGDSFAFGNAIEEEAFFGNLPGAVRIKAVGAPGYNMVQSLWWMDRMGPQLTGKDVVWLIYPANDLEDNLRPQMKAYRTPFVRESDGGWEIVADHVRQEPWPFPFRRPNTEYFVEICRPSYLSQRAFSACAFLLERAAAVCRSHGARLTVMTIPDLSAMNQRIYAALLDGSGIADYDPDLPDRNIGKLAAELGVPFVALADHLEPADYFAEDVHWNARGHQRVAAVLRDIVHGNVAKPEHVVTRRSVGVAGPVLGKGRRSEPTVA
jgi:hypothetical protein